MNRYNFTNFYLLYYYNKVPKFYVFNQYAFTAKTSSLFLAPNTSFTVPNELLCLRKLKHFFKSEVFKEIYQMKH